MIKTGLFGGGNAGSSARSVPPIGPVCKLQGARKLTNSRPSLRDRSSTVLGILHPVFGIERIDKSDARTDEIGFRIEAKIFFAVPAAFRICTRSGFSRFTVTSAAPLRFDKGSDYNAPAVLDRVMFSMITAGGWLIA